MSDSIIRQESDESMLSIVQSSVDHDIQSDDPISRCISCNSCESFIIDWIRLPLKEEEPFYSSLNWPLIWKIAPDIAKIYFKILMEIPKNFKSMIEFALYDEMLEGIDTRYTILEYINKEERDYLEYLLEDKGCNTNKIQEWIGYCLITLWNILDNIHLQHQKLAPVHNIPIALGLQVFRPSNTNSRAIP